MTINRRYWPGHLYLAILVLSAFSGSVLAAERGPRKTMSFSQMAQLKAEDAHQLVKVTVQTLRSAPVTPIDTPAP